jgi:hypothetical protein
LPDKLFPGTPVGFPWATYHTNLVTVPQSRGAIENFNSGEPLDQLMYDWGCAFETGMSLSVSPWQAALQVNPATGLFLYGPDWHARLNGWALDIQSAAHEESSACDEGFLFWRRGIALTPREALGQWSSDTNIESSSPVFTLGSMDDMRKGRPVYKTEEKKPPFYRWQEYGGHLGHLRFNFATTPTGLPLFTEKIDAAGAWTVSSAKRITLAKTILAGCRNNRRPDRVSDEL